MRVQKSVYRMTDRELRLYKRQLRRKQQIRRRVFTMITTICVIVFCAVSYQGIRSLASSGKNSWSSNIILRWPLLTERPYGICLRIILIMKNIRIRMNISKKYRVSIIWQRKTRSELDRLWSFLITLMILWNNIRCSLYAGKLYVATWFIAEACHYDKDSVREDAAHLQPDAFGIHQC